MSDLHVHSYAVVKMTIIRRYKEAFLSHRYWEQRLKNDYNITPQELQQIQNVALEEQKVLKEVIVDTQIQ